MAYDLSRLSDYKAWRLHYSELASFFDVIVTKWRRSSASAPDRPGKWAAYAIDEWATMAGISAHQVERRLRALEAHGAIHRERHRFQGCKVRAFIHPVAAVLKHESRAGDIEKLPAPPIKKYPKPSAGTGAKTSANAGMVAGAGAGMGAGTGAGTDYTSTFPSLPSNSVVLKGGNSFPSGKGMGGHPEMKDAAAKIEVQKIEPAITAAPIIAPEDDTDEWVPLDFTSPYVKFIDSLVGDEQADMLKLLTPKLTSEKWAVMPDDDKENWIPSPIEIELFKPEFMKAYKTLKAAKQEAAEAKAEAVQITKDAALQAKLKLIHTSKKMKGDEKRKALLALLPKNCQAKKTWHPSEKYDKWHTWSPEKLIEKQNTYCAYVQNEIDALPWHMKNSAY